LQFTIYDSLIGGSVAGGPIFNPSSDASNGLFTVTLDFTAKSVERVKEIEPSPQPVSLSKARVGFQPA